VRVPDISLAKDECGTDRSYAVALTSDVWTGRRAVFQLPKTDVFRTSIVHHQAGRQPTTHWFATVTVRCQ
jgi:hypothetical protein